MSLPKQRTQAEAWRLFIVSGSLTWFRRPRLASFTRTTHVETIHPHWYGAVAMTAKRSYLVTARRGPRALRELLEVASGARHVAFGVSFGESLSAILLFATFGEG
jgi:hypothetical protein